MAPMRSERGGSPAAARGAHASLPLPRRLIRQIARHVASSGRSLRRLEVSGRIIDNFDDIDADDSDHESPTPLTAPSLSRSSVDMESSGARVKQEPIEEENKWHMASVNMKFLKEEHVDHERWIKTEDGNMQLIKEEPINQQTVWLSASSADMQLKEDTILAEQRVAQGGTRNMSMPDHDDELTSLSWLQDRNLLRGINFTKADVEDIKMMGTQVVVKSESLLLTPPLCARTLSPPRTPCKVPPSPPLNVNSAGLHSKPPYSFSCLIFMAIEAAPLRALPVKEIYAWIIRHFPYFRHAPQGWKNSVRHNLSLNKCFHKVAVAPGIGKGSLWTVDPQHRATLLQAFGRQPIPPASLDTPPPAKNTPDPQLFPFLARRLANCASSNVDYGTERNGSDDCNHNNAPADALGADEYLAAATVLAMKYGPRVLEKLPPAPHLVISRSSAVGDEHSYSGCDERRTAEALLNLAGVTPPPSVTPVPR